MRNSNIFGSVSKNSPCKMQTLAKRHKIMNLRKSVLDPRKVKTYISEALARVVFNNIITSSHYLLPSGFRADLHNAARSPYCRETYFDVSKTISIFSIFEICTKNNDFSSKKNEKKLKTKNNTKRALGAFNQEL